MGKNIVVGLMMAYSLLHNYMDLIALFVDSLFSPSIPRSLRRFRALSVDSVLSPSIPRSLRRFPALFVDSVLSSLIPCSLRRFRALSVDSVLSSAPPCSSPKLYTPQKFFTALMQTPPKNQAAPPTNPLSLLHSPLWSLQNP